MADKSSIEIPQICAHHFELQTCKYGRFEFVGRNRIDSEVVGRPRTVRMPNSWRIQVQAGDVIGIYFPPSKSLGVERSFCSSKEEPFFGVATYQTNANIPSKGRVFQFKADGCKIFSVSAVVSPLSTCPLPAVP